MARPAARVDGVILIGTLACAAAVWLAAAAFLRPARPHPAWTHPERDRLRDAGWRWSAVRWEAARCAVAAVCAAAGVTAGLDALAGVALGALAPTVALRVRSDLRRARATAVALDQLRAVRAALASGASLVEAIRRSVAAIGDDIAVRPLQLVMREFAVGVSLSDALLRAAGVALPGVQPALRTLAIGVDERLPVPQLSALASAVVDRLAFDEELAADVRARTSGVRMQIWAMAALVPGLALYLATTVPLVGETLRSPLGTSVLIPAAVVLEVLGVLLSRRVVRIAAP